LITGPTLPEVVSPPGVGVISGWAEYEQALDGQPVFVTRLNAGINKDQQEDGTISTMETKQAIIEGAEYFWWSSAVSASLIWRTREDYRDVREFSGCVLCLGRPADKSVKAVVFQNYEFPIKRSQIHGERKLTGAYGWLMKAGFLLPQVVRDSIILNDEKPSEKFPVPSYWRKEFQR
jgi:hypothetical protein